MLHGESITIMHILCCLPLVTFHHGDEVQSTSITICGSAISRKRQSRTAITNHGPESTAACPFFVYRHLKAQVGSKYHTHDTSMALTRHNMAYKSYRNHAFVITTAAIWFYFLMHNTFRIATIAVIKGEWTLRRAVCSYNNMPNKAAINVYKPQECVFVWRRRGTKVCAHVDKLSEVYNNTILAWLLQHTMMMIMIIDINVWCC